MRLGYYLFVIFAGLSASVNLSFAQQSGRRQSGSNPMPNGGRVTATFDPREAPPDLDMLIHMSLLIVDGTITDVQPARPTHPDTDVPSAETFSMVNVSETLSAVSVSKAPTLFLVQTGGSVGKWVVETPDAPLVKKGIRYILFLDPDERRAPFDTKGVARYNAVGVWSGFVSITDRKVAFLPNAAEELHKYDGMDVDEFLALLRNRINQVVPKNQIILSHFPSSH